MTESLRRQWIAVVSHGGQLALLAIGFQSHSRWVWVSVLAAISAISFFAWMAAYRRAQAVADTATSKIASAAQGYVELTGMVSTPPGYPLKCPVSQRPCIWYRYQVEQRVAQGKWESTESAESSESFLLKDETGTCVVDPEGAEIFTSHERTWTIDDSRYTEALLLERDTAYVLGEFITLGGGNIELDFDQDVSALLAEWKAKQPELLRRFDLDRDGKIDMKEWQLARMEARRQVEKQHIEVRNEPGIDMVRAPRDGRYFLISNLDPSTLTWRYKLWSAFHLAVFLAGLVGAFMMSR
jgi:hypothetical protein